MDTSMLMFLATLHGKVALFVTLVIGAVYFARDMSSQNRYLVLRMTLLSLIALPFMMLALPNYFVPIEWWPVDATKLTAPGGGGESSVAEAAASPAQSASMSELLLAGYWIVSAFLLFRIAVGYRRHWLKITHYPRVESKNTISLLQRIRQQLGIARNVEIVLDPSGAGPYVWGVRRSLIAVPQTFLAASLEVQRTVLTHELIHIDRHDTAICLTSRILSCFYWINPAFWLLHNKLKLEMEQSCDDRAVCSGINAADYAGHLLKAIKQFDVRHAPNAAVAMARASSTKSRIHSLLNSHRKRGIMNASKSTVIGGTLALLGVAIASCANRPTTDGASVAAKAAAISAPDEAWLASAKRLVPDTCDTAFRDIRMAAGTLEFKGFCATLPRVSALMRNAERAGVKPILISAKKTDGGFNYEMRLENLQRLAPASAR